MDKPELLVAGELPPEDLAPLHGRFTPLLYYAAPDPEAFLAEHGPRIRFIATKGEIGASATLMAALPKLGIVACYGVGVDAIDLDHARARGIRVTNTPDVLTEDVADMAWALLLATARRIPAGEAWLRDGSWAKKGPAPLTTRVWGKRLGIVGLGKVGRAVARRAEGFRMQIAYSGRTPKPDVAYAYHATPASLAAAVDMLVVCAAGGAGTRGLVDRAAIEALRPGAILVNVTRGTVVDELALIAALKAGRIAAGLDVFEGEPAIDPVFATLPNVVLSPHNASGTVETRRAIGALMRENLEAQLDGRPLPTPVV
jgi:lactate dehydrogenase-like 2-hydroxyacid dehydrogenase